MIGLEGYKDQHAILIDGSQNNGPTTGGCIYLAEGSCAPIDAFKGGPPGMPGSPWPSMAKDVPVLELVELRLSLEVVSGVVTVTGISMKGDGGCSCAACGFSGG